MNRNSIQKEISGHPEMPYERFMKYGAGALTNAELLAVILRTGTSNHSAVYLAGKVLGIKNPENDCLSVLFDLSIKDLTSISGIGEVKAVKLLCIAELTKRMAMEKAGRDLVFTSPSSIAEYYMEALRHEKQERVILLLLDNRLALIRDVILSVGTVNASMLSPREVFIKAADGGAVYIVLLHNHPSGDPSPSDEDINVTRKIAKLGREMEIQLIDHIIIGDHCYTSLKEKGCI